MVPNQRRQYLTLRDAGATLARAAPGTGNEGAIQAGLKVLTDEYLAREWKRDDEAVMQVGRRLIDAGYVPDTVYLVNHWQDCLVGSAAAASMLGVSLFRGAVPRKVKRKRKKVPTCHRRTTMAKRGPGRPKGSKNATDVVVVKRSQPAAVGLATLAGRADAACPKCGSSRRSEYWGRLVQKCPGLRAHGTPYTAIIRHRCGSTGSPP